MVKKPLFIYFFSSCFFNTLFLLYLFLICFLLLKNYIKWLWNQAKRTILEIIKHVLQRSRNKVDLLSFKIRSIFYKNNKKVKKIIYRIKILKYNIIGKKFIN